MGTSLFLGRAALAAACASGLARAQEGGADWVVLRPIEATAEGGATLELLPDGSIRASGAGGAREVYRLAFEVELAALAGLRLEAQPDAALPGGGPGRGPAGNFVLSELRVGDANRPGMKPEPCTVIGVSASWSQQGFPATAVADGDEATGWAIAPATGREQVAIFPLEREMRGDGMLRFSVEMVFAHGSSHALGRFRFLGTSAPSLLRFAAEDSWEGMQERIDAAIDKGIAYLIREQELDGSWSYNQPAFPNGQTSLALYTLLKQKLSDRHPSVQRALAFLRAAPPTMTYEMGCQLLALSALEDPSVRPWIEELAAELLEWQRSGSAYREGSGGFGYPEREVDVSNTQYGALGLWAASKAGVEIPAKTWVELARHMLVYQPAASGADAYGPAGFGYHPGHRESGSRTAAGVGVLALCETMLAPEDLRGLPIVDARRRGLAWLAKHFSVKENPRAEAGDPWLYYYLYALERVGAFTGETFIGGSDWYREGARFLVDAQASSGCWAEGTAEEQPNTCFAVLFLARATSPSTGETQLRSAASRRMLAKVYGRDDPAEDVSLRASGDTPLTAWISTFGEELTRSRAWPPEAGGGLRVSEVQFVAVGEPRAPAWWSAARPWRWTTRAPGEGWNQLGFTAASWAEGRGGFGDPRTGGALVATPWRDGDLWLARTFDVARGDLVEPEVWAVHATSGSSARGPAVSVWLDGEPLWSGDAPKERHQPLALDPPLAERLAPGRHTIAVQVRRLGAGDAFDLELRDRPLLARADADPARPASEQKLGARIVFPTPGEHELVGRVALALDGLEGGEGVVEWVESKPLRVRIEEASDPELLEYGADRARDLLSPSGATIVASSERDGWPAAHALDGLQSQAWLCKEGDERPSLSIELGRAVRADRVQLSPIRSSRVPAGHPGRAARAEIVLNKKLVHVIDIDSSEWRKSVLTLEKPQTIRELEVRLVRAPADGPDRAVGLAEIELVLGR